MIRAGMPDSCMACSTASARSFGGTSSVSRIMAIAAIARRRAFLDTAHSARRMGCRPGSGALSVITSGIASARSRTTEPTESFGHGCGPVHGLAGNA